MTIGESIELVNRLVPNQISDQTKIDWLSDFDQMVWRNILSNYDIDMEAFNGYGTDANYDIILLVPPPFDVVYRWHLEKEIHGANGETARYNGAAEKYNAALQDYMDYVNRHLTPKGTRVRWW